ncbi:MAG: Mu transposase C-terminal domain-containing protein [Thermodesulfobacteriota bacterium]|nr:Mu transposase C-terminal domain-containing protein [Thermodesulfobacteriota bacterium]
MKQAYTAKEIAEKVGKSRQATDKRARKEAWPFMEQPCNGGVKKLYPVASLPADIRDKIAERETLALVPARSSILVAEKKETMPAVPAQLKDWQREIRDARLAVIAAVESMAHECGGILAAEKEFSRLHTAGELSPEGMALAHKAHARRGNRFGIKPSTLRLWRATKEKQGPDALAPKPAQRVEAKDKIPSWLKPFLTEYCIPSKPSISQCYEELQRNGVALPSLRTVTRTLNRMSPVALNKGRLGPRALKSLCAYVKRDTSELLPGDVYTADGHKADFEVIHPEHGQAVRPEIIAVLDVATRKCVGWAAELHERAWLVADALRVSVELCGIPAIFYVDNGCGFKNEFFSGPGLGVLNRLGTRIEHSIPYNSQARGIIEKFNDTCWVKEGRRYRGYMGADMDKEVAQIVYKRSRKELAETGTTKLLMPWNNFLTWAWDKVDIYNNRPHSALPKINDPETGKRRHMTPNEMWDHLAAQTDIIRPTQIEIDDLFRPYVIRTCRRCWLSVFTNDYFSHDLEAYHGREVQVGYDIHDPRFVWVRDIEGRLITTAELDANKRPYFPRAVVDQARDKRAKAQVKRLQDKEAKVLELADAKKGKEPAPAPKQITEDVRAIQAELEAELTRVDIEEKPIDRFRRATRLEQRLDTGEEIAEADQRWLKGYQSTSEYQGYKLVYEDFGEAALG